MENTRNWPGASKEYYDGRYVKQTDIPDLSNSFFDLPDAYTMLLLHYIGVNTETTILDYSPQNHTVTPVSSAQIKVDQYKFGGSSLYLDGNIDCVYAADSDDWNFSSDSFTLETWMRFDGAASQSFSIFEQHHAATKYFKLWYDFANGGLRFTAYNLSDVCIADYYVDWVPSTATWYHVALVRYLGNIYYFIDGVTDSWTGINTQITAATAFPDYTAPMVIGVEAGSGILGFKGWLAETRISKETPRWTDNFTPATNFYGFINGGLLQTNSYLAFKETNEPPQITDTATVYVKDDGLLYFKNSSGVETNITTGAITPPNFCSFYVEKAFALITGVGPYTLPHTPVGDTGTDGDGNTYHKIQVFHGMAPQTPVKITSLVTDQLTLAFAPSSGFFVLFVWQA